MKYLVILKYWVASASDDTVSVGIFDADSPDAALDAAFHGTDGLDRPWEYKGDGSDNDGQMYDTVVRAVGDINGIVASY